MKAIHTQAIIEGIRSRKDKSLGLSLSTPELSTEEKALFMDIQGLNVDILINPLDMLPVPEYKVEKDLNSKTPSVRMRNVMFILWKQDNESMDFDTFYKTKMEKLIEHLKGKIVDQI